MLPKTLPSSFTRVNTENPVLPEVAQLLASAAAQSPPPLDLTVPELRAFCDEAVLQHHDLVRPVELHEVQDGTSPGGVPVRVYRPSADPDLPVHVHLHGGGWWMG